MTDQTVATTAGFKTLVEVGPDHLGQVRDIEARFQEALAPSAQTYRFGPVQQAAKDLPDGSIVRIIPGFGLQEQAPAHVMVLTLKEAVRQALTRPFGNEAFWERAEEALTRVFVGLGEQQDAPHLVFTATDADSTGYDYHLLFALQDEETEGFVYVIAFSVHVTVGLGRDAVLALAVEDTAPFAIRLDALCVRQPLR
ncbi:Type-2Aa cytolytic delta-endotoxin [Streptomyces monticola]|uniref:Type-2Aa cytolytic delta-endotoxin n=1 Tax=Streptomyces monticola TaxID=2666263 RepID=A0ABW2JFJ5_9ACTN